jgi:transposase
LPGLIGLAPPITQRGGTDAPQYPPCSTEQTATVRPDLTLYASLELNRATWLVTCLSPERDRVSKYSTPGSDGGALLGLLERMRARAQQLTGRPVKIVVIQEAGLDGFWVHRLLEANGIESHVVDPASIGVPRRRRRAKTDAIDGETLLRTLLAWAAENRVSVRWSCRRRRKRKTVGGYAASARYCCRSGSGTRTASRVCSQDRASRASIHCIRTRRQLLDVARTGDGRPLPHQLKAEILREIELIELLLRQIADVEAAREVLAGSKTAKVPSPVVLLKQLKGIGPEIASVLYFEGLFRSFGNRRQLGAYAGLAPTPWRSGHGGPGARHLQSGVIRVCATP